MTLKNEHRAGRSSGFDNDVFKVLVTDYPRQRVKSCGKD